MYPTNRLLVLARMEEEAFFNSPALSKVDKESKRIRHC